MTPCGLIAFARSPPATPNGYQGDEIEKELFFYLFNEENDSIAKAMVAFDEVEQVKKKLFIAISFDSHWALIKNHGPGLRLITLPSLALIFTQQVVLE